MAGHAVAVRDGRADRHRGGYQVHTQPMRWPLVSIVLYVGMALSIRFMLDPMDSRISAMGKAARERAQAAQAAGAAAAGSGTPSRAPAGDPPQSAGGPPPDLMKLVARTRRDGKLLSVVVIVILFLMVVKPAFPV